MVRLCLPFHLVRWSSLYYPEERVFRLQPSLLFRHPPPASIKYWILRQSHLMVSAILTPRGCARQSSALNRYCHRFSNVYLTHLMCNFLSKIGDYFLCRRRIIEASHVPKKAAVVQLKVYSLLHGLMQLLHI